MTGATVDLSDLKRLGRPKRRKPCAVAVALAAIPEDAVSVISEALLSDDEDTRRGARVWLAKHDAPEISPSAATYHRDGRCRCNDDA